MVLQRGSLASFLASRWPGGGSVRQSMPVSELLCGGRHLARAEVLRTARVMMRGERRFLRGWFGHRSTLPARRHAANRQELARWRVCRRRKERSVIRRGLRRLWGAPVWNWRDAFHLFFPFRNSPLAGPLTNMVAIPSARHTKPAHWRVSFRTRPSAPTSIVWPSTVNKTSGTQLHALPCRIPHEP